MAMQLRRFEPHACLPQRLDSVVLVQAVALVRERGLHDRVGLHLNLTEGRPVHPDSERSSLVISGQRMGGDAQPSSFLGKTDFVDACFRGAIQPHDVVHEARAQLAWFRARFGRAPRHVDGHQHCHIWPATRGVLAALFAAEGVEQTRVPEARIRRNTHTTGLNVPRT